MKKFVGLNDFNRRYWLDAVDAVDGVGGNSEALRARFTSVGDGIRVLRYLARGVISCVDRERKWCRSFKVASIPGQRIIINVRKSRSNDLTCLVVAFGTSMF